MSELNTILQASYDLMDDRFGRLKRMRDAGEHDTHNATEAMATACCKHLNAFCEVILPAVSKRGGAKHGYVDCAKAIEDSSGRLLKTHSAEAWEDFSEAYTDWRRQEPHVLDLLDNPDSYAAKFSLALAHAASHPHPHLWHTGPLSHAVRAMAAKADERSDRRHHRPSPV